jgi:hypothetical protein
MKTDQLRETGQAFEALRQFTRRPQKSVERCELCSAEVYTEHPHLIESARRRLLCACDACAMLFTGQSGTKYKRVSRRICLLENFHMSDAEWDSLLIPINLAFFFHNSLDSRVTALYPSPAGATESLLSLEAWNNIVAANPSLFQMESDVEALLVNRVGHARGAARAEYYIVPIDACYKLVGLIRIHWRGLSGGTEVWQEIGNFFSELRKHAEVVNEGAHA